MSTTAPRPADIWLEPDGLLAVAAQRLPAYLLVQRWYPAKDAGTPRVTLQTWLPLALPQLPAGIALWRVEPPGRAPLQLCVPLALFPEGTLAEQDRAVIGRCSSPPGLLGDALASDGFVRALVQLMREPAAISLRPLTAGRTAQFEQAALDPGEWPVRRFTVEQSNTSIRVGERAILKLLRRSEPGVHPELEMGRFLTEVAHFAATPALLGWIEVGGSALVILQEFVRNDGDGWGWVLGQLREETAGGPARSLDWIRGLGSVTARMHLAFALRTGDPAFDPEPATPADWQRWLLDVAARARRVRESLRAARADLDPASRGLAEAFEQRFETLLDGLHTLLPAESTVARTRHHGDYHLGQTLVQGADAVIVDFEGEPMRPLAERRAKHVPLRDVAGMLRSFSYAAAVAGREPAAPPASGGAGGSTRLTRWEADAERVFLDSYLETAGTSPGCPAERAAALRLVRFFTIEKALYEIDYELANRPAWVGIPLSGLLGAMQAPGQTRRIHRMPMGTELLEGGGVRFRLWAPASASIRLEWGGAPGSALREAPLAARGDGWHELVVPQAEAGTRYRFVLPDGVRVPDPASRFQPEDVHAASEVIDPAAHAWTDGAWRGRPWHEAVIYELHVGAFTAAGTFRAAVERLDDLAELGITAIEIMPVADFPGSRNWGYDGVLPFAPDSSYGRPEDLKALVEAAHARGLMVLLDVVYNHFGPDGNYLPLYVPELFTERHHTPWGGAVNFDAPGSAWVREFVIHNALYWIEEYHLDGLRLDAVHAILDDSARHVLDELAERVRALRPQAHLVLENEDNEARRLVRGADGAPLEYTAQWNDDVHHALHVAVTGESNGYYREYLGAGDQLARALAEGFAFQGQMMEFRGTPRGEPSASLPPTAFVAFLQNHDQIGNRAFGERITAIALEPQAVRSAAAVQLLLPQVPMLFMGEEWAAAQPFPFFCDFHGELAAAVRRGRREEFARFPEFQDEAMRERIPDPQAESTFDSAKLAWHERNQPGHAAWLAFYRELLAVRRASVIPLLPSIGGNAAEFDVLGPAAVAIRWHCADGARLTLAANLSAQPRGGFPPVPGRLLWQEGMLDADGNAGPWYVSWSLLPRGGVA